jgi:uncharacterized protein with HEPN domain
MRNRSKGYLWDMLQAVQAIQQYTEHKTLEDYRSSTLLRDAVERRFQILGEALVRLRQSDAPTAERIEHQERIVGFRNVLAHEYDRVEPDQVWSTIQERLPALKVRLEALLAEPDEPGP